VADPAFTPRLRTGVVLTGTGTAGAYHAGALRAITESGIQFDIIAAHGTGVLTALATAVDAGPRVWDPGGPWTDRRLLRAYRWRTGLRLAFVGLALCLLLLLTPLVVLALAAGVHAAATLLALLGLTDQSASVVGWYTALVAWLFSAPVLPTVVPRLMVLGFLCVAAVLGWSAWRAIRTEPTRRRMRGGFWWRLLAWPLDADEPAATGIDFVWRLVSGAAGEGRPADVELGRRYVDTLTDNFGQPGFHEILLGVHDLDAGRDIIGAVLEAPGRAVLELERPATAAREGEVVDFTGPDRDTLAAFIAGSVRLPLLTAPALLEFGSTGYWRAERHRICDRPDLAVRLVDELVLQGAEQIILISPASEMPAPHQLRRAPASLRARMGELLRSFESVAVTEAAAAAARRVSSVYVIRPRHNPLGPFDFGGVYDEKSDRHRTVAELLQQGYADAYQHLIEPMAAAVEAADPV
jgi:hypothetical protein